MFCKFCGAQLNDGIKFCSSCGAATSAAGTDTTHANTAPKATAPQKKKPTLILVVAAILLVVFFALPGGNGAEKAAVTFIESILDADAKKCVSLLTDDAVEETGSATRKVLINTMEDALEDMQDQYKNKYGKKWKYEVSVIDSYDCNYNNGDYVEEAVKVVVEIQHTGKGFLNEDSGSETETLILVKEGRKWLVTGFGF